MDSRSTSLEVDEELRDLGHEAAWVLSSAKPGNGTWAAWASKKNGTSAARFFLDFLAATWVINHLLTGIEDIYKWPFSIAMLNYQRV